MLLKNARAVAALAVVGSAFTTGAILTPTADAAFPGTDGRIAYTKLSGLGTEGNLHVVRPDGTEQLQLTFHDGLVAYANWSPDSERIVYFHRPEEGVPTYRVYTWDTKEDVVVHSGAGLGQPTWHPDGQHIVYEEDGDIWMRPADPDSTEDPVNLTNSDATEQEPAVKPDGTKLAFTTVTGDPEIAIMDLATRDVDTLTVNQADEGDPQWHPTENRLVFWREITENQTTQPEIVQMVPGANGQGTRMTNDPSVDVDPSFAPSGTKIAWRGQRAFEGVNGARIWTMHPEGAPQAPIGATPVVTFYPHWGSNLDPVPADKGDDETPSDPKEEPKDGQKAEVRQETKAPVVVPPITVDPVKVPRVETAVRSVTVKRCVSKRRFTIRLRAPRGAKIASASVKVRGKAAKVSFSGGRHRAEVDLRTMPKGRFAVDITVRTDDGRTIRSVRRYRTCAGAKKRS